jgi:hypothetical protein
MDYLKQKKEILELKLSCIHFQILKLEYRTKEYYEKSSLMADEEKKLQHEIEILGDYLMEQLITKLAVFKPKSALLHEIHSILDLLFEIPKYQNPDEHKELKKQVMSSIQSEYMNLWKQKKEMHKECRFEEASEVQKQLLELSQFIMRNG